MRTVLWDMDGTIADTEELHYRSWHETMATVGIDYGYETFLADFGKNNGEILRRELGVDATLAAIVDVSKRKERSFREMVARETVPLLPGVAYWLAELKEAGVRQVVSSSGAMANIAALVAHLQVGDYFLALMSGYSLPRGKPHPAIFLNSAAAVGVTPAHCIVVEDSRAGIEAARRAGMASIAVGKIAEGDGLQQLLNQIPGQTCLPAPSLANVTWADFDALWLAAGLVTHPASSAQEARTVAGAVQ